MGMARLPKDEAAGADLRARRLETYRRAAEKKRKKIDRMHFEISKDFGLPGRLEEFLKSDKNQNANAANHYETKAAVAAAALDQFLKKRGF